MFFGGFFGIEHEQTVLCTHAVEILESLSHTHTRTPCAPVHFDSCEDFSVTAAHRSTRRMVIFITSSLRHAHAIRGVGAD